MDPAGAMTIDVYGYPQDEDELDSPLRLTEITIVADAAVLRKLAAFLSRTADLMDQHGATFGHEHFADFCGGLSEGATDVIVNK